MSGRSRTPPWADRRGYPHSQEATVTATVATTSAIAARADGVWKVYGSGEAQVVALRGVSVDLHRGQLTAVIGPSGSGKSTLMHCLAGLDTVSRGEVRIGGTSLTGLSDARLTKL